MKQLKSSKRAAKVAALRDVHKSTINSSIKVPTTPYLVSLHNNNGALVRYAVIS